MSNARFEQDKILHLMSLKDYPIEIREPLANAIAGDDLNQVYQHLNQVYTISGVQLTLLQYAILREDEEIILGLLENGVTYSSRHELISYAISNQKYDMVTFLKLNLPPDKKYEIAATSFTVSKQLGNGSYGNVYIVNYRGQDVAMKSPNSKQKKAYLEKSTKNEITFFEYISASRQQHPHQWQENIIEYIGFSNDNSSTSTTPRYSIFLALAKESLFDRVITDESDLPWYHEGNRYALEIAKALAYLHHLNIIHRDLKLKNILLDENNNIKVCDFGLSQFTFTQSTYGGTRKYMAPESLNGDTNLTVKSDCFSFGCIMHEIITQREIYTFRPIKKEDFVTLIVKEKYRDDYSRFLYSFSIQIEPLIDQCWDADPNKRPSADQIIEKLTFDANNPVTLYTNRKKVPVKIQEQRLEELSKKKEEEMTAMDKAERNEFQRLKDQRLKSKNNKQKKTQNQTEADNTQQNQLGEPPLKKRKLDQNTPVIHSSLPQQTLVPASHQQLMPNSQNQLLSIANSQAVTRQTIPCDDEQLLKSDNLDSYGIFENDTVTLFSQNNKRPLTSQHVDKMNVVAHNPTRNDFS